MSEAYVCRAPSLVQACRKIASAGRNAQGGKIVRMLLKSLKFEFE
jgi:hypothetical protein